MSDDDIPIDDLIDGLDVDNSFGSDDDDRDVDSEILGADIVNWRELTKDQAPEVWTQLREWVEWLSDRYNLDLNTVPACWWKHSPLVEELSAIHTAWLASFDSTDAGYGPIGWHERFAQTRTRLKSHYNGDCTRGHTDRPARSWPANAADSEWQAWIRTPRTPQSQ